MITYHNKNYFKDNETICTFFCDAPRTEQIHINEFWEFCYVYEGEGTLNTDTTTIPIKAGQFLLISPNMPYSVLSPPKKEGALVRMCKCIFTQEYFKSILAHHLTVPDIKNYELHKLLTVSKPFHLHLSDDRRNNVEHLLWLIAHEYGHFTTGSKQIMEYAMLSLFICISRLYENQVNKYVETASNIVIEDIKNYIKANFGYKVSLEDLAGRFHLSREYLSRYFKHCTGKTISEFLLEVRMERAKSKLSTTLIPIADISEYCGYPSQSNFQKAFKKATGQTPSEYRKTHKIITKQ